MSKIKDKLKKNRRKIVICAIVLILASLVVYGAYVYVVTTWIVIIPPLEVDLLHPEDGAVLTENTTWFNWTGSGGNGTLTYVWYADTDPTFTSSNRRVVDLGTTDNYTADPFADGDWYWRVEVTDGENINVSATWHFKVQTVPGNNFPYLENGSVSPTEGTTGTTFHYNVTFYDLDNDTASYVNVSISGTQYIMSEVDASDINTTDGKNYTYTTTLPVGVHNYSFVCSDGNATNSTILYTGPTVAQAHAPVMSNPSPANESTGVELTPGFSITVSDQNGEIMDITWYGNSSGVWTVFATDTNVGNGTYNQNNPNITEHDKTYWWKIVVTNGDNTTSAIYHFTTKTSIRINGMYPENNSVDVCPCSALFFNVTNDEGNLMNVTVFMKNESAGDYSIVNWENNTGNGTVWFCLGAVAELNETYYWYVNITDTTDNNFTSNVYKFTTVDNILSCNVSSNASFGGGSCAWVIGVAVALMCVPLVFALRKEDEK